MDLETLIAETFTRVMEGGAAVGGERISRDMIQPTIDAFKEQVLSKIQYTSVKPIGSTGKKAESGDIDLGLDTELSPEQVGEIIKKLNMTVKINKGLGEVSVLFPQHDKYGNAQDKNAQIDLMIGPEAWMQFSYYGPSDVESKYKGVHSAALRTAMLRTLAGFSVSPNRGIFASNDPKKEYYRDPSFMAKEISKYSKEPWTTDDLQQPFEKMWDKATRSFDSAQLQKIKEYVAGYLKNNKQPIPQEITEATHMAYDKVQPWYGNLKGAQKGQGNIGGPRNRGSPGYPVPPEMTSKRGAEGFSDEGFQTQDEASAPDRFGNRATGMNTQKTAGLGSDGTRGMGAPEYPKSQGMDPGMGNNYLDEAVDPSELQKGIVHLDDLKPEQFLAFLKKYQDMEISGGLEVSEKVDGSARISFGKGAGHIWTQSKNGTRKAQSNQYPDTPMYKALKKAHEALESKAPQIMAQWPPEVAFFVAEVLYTRFPNSIEYGPNVLMIHGVIGNDSQTFDDATSKKYANSVLKATGGELSDGNEPWKFEYKRTIAPKDVLVDVKKEFDTLGQLYQDLSRSPRDKTLKTKFQTIQKQVKEKLIGQLRKQKSAYGPEGGDVEGLVFRDLDNGTMVKLVDKDFFTSLNNFLWHHRKMLDAGGKVNGEWKKGLMQGFREVVADQVLGDKSAASTMLVKNLLQIAQSVQGRTPEERANKTLAAYIKQNRLMAKDSFARDFQRSLMGAFKELQNMKAEWEEYKSKPQSMEFGGKTRTYPPEHMERTDQAMQGAEASLQGIRAGMDVAAKIKQPMTQKVALLKLFMGHKFEKLVSALAGEQEDVPVEEGVSSWARGVGAAALLGAGGMTASDNRHLDMEPMVIRGDAPSIKDFIEEAAEETGVPARLIAAIMTVESHGNPNAMSPKGAMGLMQVLPSTAKAMGIDNPMDPRQNILAGSRYLKRLSNAFNGNLDWVIAAYNMGPTALHRAKGGHRPPETRNYLKKVHKLLGNKKPVLKTESVFGDAGDLEVDTSDAYAGPALMTTKYKDLLAKNGIRVGKYLGQGVYGMAWDIGGGKVLKVTNDADEARTSMFMMNKPHKYIAHIYKVFRFPEPPDQNRLNASLRSIEFFGIVLEKLKTLKDGSPQDRHLTSALYQIREMVGEDVWTDSTTDWQSLHDYALNLEPLESEIVDDHFAIMDQFNIGKIRQEINDSGVWFTDYHPGNIGQRADGTWVIFDLGSESQSPGGAVSSVPVLEGGPIDRMTGPTDLGGKKIGPADPDVTLENIVYEQITRLIEAQQGTIGVTIGRFQPFHAGHATIIRQLANAYSNVVVFIAGQKIDAKNPFSHDLRLKMMELSLPDVWSKLKVFPATISGKGTGYIPGLIANAALSGMAAIPIDGSVDVLVGEDRLKDQETQVKNNIQHQGEPGFYAGTINVRALPDVKNDDDAGRISGTRVREALAGNDRKTVETMLDPHLVQSSDFADIYKELREQLAKNSPVKKSAKKVGEMVEMIINELGMGAADGGPGATRGGGSSGWSRAILARDMTGDEVYNQMLRSPSTRMLQMANHGTPNDHLPGMDALDQKDSSEQDSAKPTDLGEMIVQTMRKMVEGGSKQKLSPQEKAARALATKAKVDAKNRSAAEARREKSKEILADPSHPQHMKERDWYNGARKRMGWPDLPPLREPVISMIDVENKWVPWSPEAMKVPWIGKNPEDDDEKEGTTKAIGNGEFRLIKQLGPNARKSNEKTHDLDVDKDIEQDYSQIIVGAKNTLNIAAGPYEVKAIEATKSAFAGAKGDEFAATLRSKYTYTIDEIRDFVESVEITHAGDVSALRHFINSQAKSIWVGGHIATGNINALKTAVETVAEPYKIPAHPLHKYAVENLGKNKRTIPYYSDPDLVMQDYMNVGRPSDIFRGLQGIIIVKEEGFAVIPIQDVDKYIEVSSISKGQMKIRLTRQIPKIKSGALAAQESLTTPEPTPFSPKITGA